VSILLDCTDALNQHTEEQDEEGEKSRLLQPTKTNIGAFFSSIPREEGKNILWRLFFVSILKLVVHMVSPCLS